MITLGIDVGTTHTKVLALDIESGRTLTLESAATPVRRDADGDVRRAAEVLEVVIDLATRVVAALPDPDDVSAVCVASLGEEVVLVDRTGHALGDGVVWYDPRGFEEARAFGAGLGGEVALSQRWPPDPTFSLFKLMWARDHRPDEYRSAVTWTDLGDYVLYGLGGELVMDWSHASRAGAFDIIEHAWDRASIEAAGLDIDFPRLVPSGTIIGSVDGAIARDIGLSPDVAIVTGGHDHLCAAYGAGVRSTTELFLSAGTSEAHLALLEEPAAGDTGPDRVDQGCYVDDHTWYAHTNIHSGHFFRQWRELLYHGVDDETMYAEVSAATTDGIAFELAADMRLGRLDGVPYDADRAVLMRAILEGLARRSAAIIDSLERVSGTPYELVLVAGHPTRLPLWRALRQAAYARPMAAVDEPENTAYGAAVIAARSAAGTAADHLVASRTTWT